MLRRLVRVVFLTAAGGGALVAGVLTALTLTPTGRGLLARAVARALIGAVNGRIEIATIGGSFVRDLVFRGVVLRDTAGVVVARLPEVRVQYRLGELLGGNVILRRVALDRPELHLVQWPDGRLNLAAVLGLGGDGARGGPPPLVALYDVALNDGRVTLERPWRPRVRTAAQRDSARTAQLAAHPGRRIEQADGRWVQRSSFDALTARLPFVLASSPSRKPLTVRIDSLAVAASDPQLRVTDVTGQVEVRGDTLAFQLQRVALPGTEAIGGGRVFWPRDTVLFDFRFNAPRVDLADLRFVSPGFPAMRGRGSVAAFSESGARTTYTIRNLVLEDGRERIGGDLVAVVDARRGLGVRQLNTELTRLDVAKVLPYAPSLPFRGTIDGRLEADGFLDALEVTLDWRYADAQVRGMPVSRVRGEGGVSIGPRGLAFRDFYVAAGSADLGTVRRLAPVVPLAGRLAAEGTLDGPLDDIVFEGRLAHTDGALPESAARGRFALDLRGAEAVVDVEAELEPLNFDGIRPTYPGLALQGELRGPVRLVGPASRLAAEFDVAGLVGRLRGTTLVRQVGDTLALEAMDVTGADVDLREVDPRWTRTRLAGRLEGTVTTTNDSLRATELRLAVAPSTGAGVGADSGSVRLGLRDGVLAVDTLDLFWNGAHLAASGALGWGSDRDGRLVGALEAPTLRGFDSLLTARAGAPADTTIEATAPLDGTARLTLDLAGRLDSLDATATLQASGLRWRRWRLPAIGGAFAWHGGTTPILAASLAADSLRGGTQVFRDLNVTLGGATEVLGWSGAVRVGDAAALSARGRWWTQLAPNIASIDTLEARLPQHTWTLENPVAITLRDSTQAITPVVFRTNDGSGEATIVGRVPGVGEGGLSLAVLGVDLRDVYALLQRDTTGVRGALSLTGEVGGTAAAPTLQGALTAEALVVEQAKLPLVSGSVRYADRRLDADLALWRTGERALEVAAQLPLDLAWRDAGPRLVPDQPLLVRARGDSVDLAVLEAVSTNVRDVAGLLSVDVRAEGTWAAPRLAGAAEVRNGRLTVRGLGTTFAGVRGRFDFAGDSLVLRGVRLEGTEEGRLDVSGSIRVPGGLAQPVLDLQLDADRFRAMDVPGFLQLTGTGRLTLRGPALGATLRGEATATRSVLWFADLVNKRVINIDDPALAELVAQDTVAKLRLRGGLSTRFFETLEVEDFGLAIGENVRLRSSEADIVLGGGVRVNKRGRTYRFDGTLNAERGTYALLLAGVLKREFTVERGAVRFFGRTDLNAELDIEAKHLVRATRGDEVPVIARIEGTLYAPKVRLQSTPERQLTEADLASYLLTGAAFGDVEGRNVQRAVGNSLLSSFVGEAIGNFGLPIDLLEVKLGVLAAGGNAPQQQQVQTGVQLTGSTYLLLNVGFCPGQGVNGGVAVQYRFSRAFRFQTSIEPRQQFCAAVGSSLGAGVIGRQFGADLLFEKEF